MTVARPTRRVILLGASNVARSFATIVETARQTWNEPVEIMAAMGYGRSYGQDSWFLGRKISGIFPCALWHDLETRSPLPTAALLTDVGNDLLYEVPVPRIAEWVAGCLDRLADAGATTIMTQLPMASASRLGDRRFVFFRTLFYPPSRITLAAVKAGVGALNERLVELGEARKTPVIPVSDAWYGLDPIHLKRTVWSCAWPEILSGWCVPSRGAFESRPTWWERAYVRCLAPAERVVLGVRCRALQPSGRLSDGTTISLY